MRLLFSSALAIGAASPLWAQTSSGPADPPGFPIEDRISVIGSVLERSPANQSLETLDTAEIEAIKPASIADVLRLSPSANITTNSRGETLVYLRNAGERQTALYFDGAALNIPWDNRINLATIPAGAIGSVDVQSGPASSLYGVNAAGGVIEIAPLSPFDVDQPGALSLSVGEADLRQGQIRWADTHADTQFMLAAEYLEHETQPGVENTDRERVSLIGRIRQDIGDQAYLSASILHSQAAFGIAPARFDRTSQGRQRFWRYPEADQTLVTVRGGLAVSQQADLHASVWHQSARQTINAFTDDTYLVLDETQRDEDLAYGLRLIGDIREIAGGDLRLSLTVLDTSHDQSEVAAGQDPATPDRFGDRRYSVGAEYERDLGESLTLFAGASADRLEATETAGRPETGDFDTWNATAGLFWHVGERWSLRSSLSRKARIPTLRELYGTALNRFLPNPDLEAETLYSADMEIRYGGDTLNWSVTPFAWQQDDTLDQINLTLNGQRLRQRVNAQGAKALGVETRLNWQISDQISFDAGLTAMRLRREDSIGLDNQRFLSERPELIARLAARYQASPALSLSAEASHRGRAYSFTDEDVFEPLARSTALNLGLDYAPQTQSWDLFVRVDNVTDTRIEPQLGLPSAGRWMRMGVRLRFGG
ncbi:TonB-dependent receptor [Maricaulis sp. D1M11]|uniref:TonB-dependent receptor n=1 Tax=Maricaulis sp. D1M11 TaxID=3076117 RepID=UPI0039B4F6D2